MHLLKFIFIFIFSSILSTSFCFADTKVNRPNLGVLNGYQFYFKTYDKKYHLVTWDGNITTLEQALSLNKSPVDILLLNKTTADQACERGLLISLPDDLLSSDTKQCDFQTITDHIALAWDTRKIHFNPTWKDFWNITQYPGRRGLQKDAFSALSIALLADNVPPDEIIETLSTPSGILRAFKKLNQLRPYIVWWTTPNDANFLLKNNQVLMTSASVLSILSFQQQHPNLHFKFQQNNTIENSIVFSIPITIQTSRIKIIYNLLKKNPLFPFPSTNLDYSTKYPTIKQFNFSSPDSSISLDKIFDEWLHLSNPK